MSLSHHASLSTPLLPAHTYIIDKGTQSSKICTVSVVRQAHSKEVNDKRRKERKGDRNSVTFKY